jgi:hypothetical protein
MSSSRERDEHGDWVKVKKPHNIKRGVRRCLDCGAPFMHWATQPMTCPTCAAKSRVAVFR